MMKSKFLLYLLLFLNSISFFSVYSQPVKAFPFQTVSFNWFSPKENPQNEKSGQNSDQNITLPKEVTPNRLYPTGRFQTMLIVPQDTSSETSCPELKYSTPTVHQITKTSISPKIVLRDETGTLWSESLPFYQNSQKIPSNYLSPGKTYSLTITNPVNSSSINNTNSVDENSSTIIPFSVISDKGLCSDLQKISENKDKETDEYQKDVRESLLYAKYNLYSYAIPRLEKLLSNDKIPRQYNVVIYTSLALYYDEMGFLRKALEEYNKALEEAKKCSEKIPCDFKMTDDQNINATQVQAFINQRLGYIYLYNPNLNDANLANTKPIPQEQRLNEIIEYLTKSTDLLQCKTLKDDPNCKTLNEKLELLKQLR